MKKYVAYYRVSTHKQGASGLGIDAQRSSVAAFINFEKSELLYEFTEIESGKGSDALSRRLQLSNAIEMCRKTNSTLLIAKLDRLARNVHFISGLIESGCEFIAADMPHANKVMLQIHAVLSEFERDQISIRTKQALMAAKERGVRLGKKGPDNLKPNLEHRKKQAQTFAECMLPLMKGFMLEGLSQRKIATRLNTLGIKTPMGKKWTLIQVQRTIHRLNLMN